jgi:ankyrin repeat protein
MCQWAPGCTAFAEVLRLVQEAGEDVNEVEAAGNTPLHSAAFEGWAEGVELLLRLGAKVNASNNAGAAVAAAVTAV